MQTGAEEKKRCAARSVDVKKVDESISDLTWQLFSITRQYLLELDSSKDALLLRYMALTGCAIEAEVIAHVRFRDTQIERMTLRQIANKEALLESARRVYELIQRELEME